VTHLHKMMLEELQRRHYCEATTQRYIRFIERFAQHFHRSPDGLGPQHIREYQAQLFTVRKLTPGTVTNHLCALRFLYIQTLKRPWSVADTPYPKKRYRLPTVLSPEEVAQLIDAAPTPFYRTILMTLYGTGARRTELTRLTHRVAISNHRLVALADGQVNFRRRDSADDNRQKIMTFSRDEFLRRFLLHLLPRGFVRIRHFGFLANRRHGSFLPLCFAALDAVSPQAESETSTDPTAHPLWRCPKCGGPMVVIERFTAVQLQLRSPPLLVPAA
jgi:hypothetical protein